MTFAVIFEPELPDLGLLAPPSKVSWTLAYDAAERQPAHDLRYVICGKVIGYYPASLATLLGDLRGELAALRAGNTHNVSMSGYTVLVAEVSEDTVLFRDPGPDAELVGSAPIAAVRTELERASARLWACLLASGSRTA